MSIQKKSVLVLGGAGAVGEGIAKAFLDAQWQVVVPSRSESKLERLRERLAATEGSGGAVGSDGTKLVTLVGDLGTVDGAEAIRTAVLERVGSLQAVVASLGGWKQGVPLTRVSLEVWERILHDNLTSHFLAARTFLPAVAASGTRGTYTFLGGFSAETPYPGAAPMSITGAAQIMMMRALAEENTAFGVRVNELLLGPIITRVRPQGDPEWLRAEEVGQVAVRLASDAGAHINGRVLNLVERSRMAQVLAEMPEAG
ncbi:MAG: SDR family oxidoreductase [Armatimonadaceae bacterium]